MQIGEFELVQEATPIVDERLLEEVNLAAKLPDNKVGVHASKDIKVVKKLASPKGAGGSILTGIDAVSTSPAYSNHSVDGPTSLQLIAKKISTVAESISHEVVKGKSTATLVSFTSFRPGPASQSFII